MNKVAINGFGRIGKLAFRQMVVDKDFDVIAINSLASAEEIAYQIVFDSTHGIFHEDEITFDQDNIIIKGIKKIKVFQEKDPINLPWGDLNVDVVLDCTGVFTKKSDLEKHIQAGAKKVVLSAPAKDEMKTVVFNVNDDIINQEDKIISAASCTTNCLAPVLDLINKNFEINIGYMTTIHAYTGDQMLLDGIHKKGIFSRRGRSGSNNIVPASTGAAKAIGKVIPNLNGKIDGTSLRVPVATGSCVDLTLVLNSKTSFEEVNSILKNNQNETLKYTEKPIVSSDIKGDKHGCIVDGLSTRVVTSGDNQIVKILAWYDNETGYTAQMLRTTKKLFD